MKRHFMAVVCLVVLCAGVIAQEKAEKLEDITLSDGEKVYWLGYLWSEAKYNFAYFDQVPDLDWDAAFKEYVPKVLMTKDARDYYLTLIEFMALLHDGHTDVSLSGPIRDSFDNPPVVLHEIEGKPVVSVVEKSLGELLPLGSVILAVDGIDALEYTDKFVMPYVAASAEHLRYEMAFRGGKWRGYGLLLRDAGSTVKVTARKPDGETVELDLPCNQSTLEDIEWLRLPRPTGLVAWRWLEDGIAYVALNSFNDEKIIGEFEAILPELYKAKGVIIDIRYNGGGNTNNGTAILAHFTDRQLQGSKWRTREHRAAYYAWSNRNPEHRYHDTYGTLNAWYEGGTMGMEQTDGPKISAPVVVLIDYFTGSAAEDFLIFADTLEKFSYVGRPTNGSTGQPIFYRLPGQGFARICSKRDTYPDGRDFVGYGVQPDVKAEPTIKGIAEGKDEILDAGLSVLKEKMSAGEK